MKDEHETVSVNVLMYSGWYLPEGHVLVTEFRGMGLNGLFVPGAAERFQNWGGTLVAPFPQPKPLPLSPPTLPFPSFLLPLPFLSLTPTQLGV